MKNKPLVTISIPTLNSSNFLDLSFKAIRNQAYKNIEINVVDGGSLDNTVEIAKKYKADLILENEGSLMSARYDGVMHAKGKYILLLDSDQILEKNTLERCVNFIEKNNLDMLILEETVLSRKTILENLFYLDRKLVHSVKDFDPHTSVLLPRFYRRLFLQRVFTSIPKKIIDYATPQDHAILYLESWKKSKKIGMIDKSLKHMEPSNLFELWRKFYRWGYYSTKTNSLIYDTYFKKRTERFRRGMFKKNLMKESLGSILLLILKGIPYKIGNLSKKIGLKLSN